MGAGIAVHMLTGDHPSTAEAIARQIGIVPSLSQLPSMSSAAANALVMTATQFDKLTDDQVDALPLLPKVIARCTPTTKVRMIDALHRRGKFCAMTGDGVNDSPSLAPTSESPWVKPALTSPKTPRISSSQTITSR